mmetsp:Transcript_57004/g.66608  ORF Transcript_57004/g.66608 Transcript_57004/m.66608 type:complete len:190 (+) Transcript_57004:185-754(+)
MTKFNTLLQIITMIPSIMALSVNRPVGISLSNPKNEPLASSWKSVNALTLVTSNMTESVSFYSTLGLVITFGGSDSTFTTFSPVGEYESMENLYINIFYSEDYEPPNTKGGWNGWGRCVIHVSNVDAIYEIAIKGGLYPESTPQDAFWGERYFHIRDPMGHELSFAKRIDDHPRWKDFENTSLKDNTAV